MSSQSGITFSKNLQIPLPLSLNKYCFNILSKAGQCRILDCVNF